MCGRWYIARRGKNTAKVPSPPLLCMPGGAGGVMAQFSLLPTQPTNERSSSLRTRHHTPRKRGKVAGVKSAASNFPDKNAWDSKEKKCRGDCGIL